MILVLDTSFLDDLNDLISNIRSLVGSITLFPLKLLLGILLAVLLWLIVLPALLEMIINIRRYYFFGNIKNHHDFQKVNNIYTSFKLVENFRFNDFRIRLLFSSIAFLFYILRIFYRRSVRLLSTYNTCPSNNTQPFRFISLDEQNKRRCQAYDYLM